MKESLAMKLKLSLITALRQSTHFSDRKKLVRESVKAADLKVGDIVLNILTFKPESVKSIERCYGLGCYLVTLNTQDDGNRFTLDIDRRIDVYSINTEL